MEEPELQKLARRAKSGKPYVKVQLKENLEHLPVAEAYALFCQLLGMKQPGRLYRREATSLLNAARHSASFFAEIEAGGVAYANRPAEVIGEGNHRTLSCTTRTSFLACFRDAAITCLSSAIACGDRLLFDFEDWEFDQIDDRLILDPRVFRSNGRDLWCVAESTSHNDIRLERAFTLNGCHSRAFGHWMWEYLPKYLAALNSGLLPLLPVLIDAGMPVQHREALELVLPSGASIVEVPLGARVAVHELWCASAPIYMPLYESINEKYRWDVFCSPPWRFAQAMRPLIAAIDALGPTTTYRKIYLARPAINHRSLVNAPAIEDLMRGLGFDVILPETMTFKQQAILLREASHVVGPEGSALFLSFFSKPGTRLAILSHPDIEGLATFTAITDELQLTTTVITGPFHERNEVWPQFSSYTIDEAVLRNFILNWDTRPYGS
jgi:hypothetical protein